MIASARGEGRSARRPSRSAAAAVAAAVLAGGGGCLGRLLPPTAAPGEATNVVLAGGLAYVALGEAGLGVYDPDARAMVRVLAPPAGAESVDDVALADGWLFALDAREPGHLASYGLADPRRPALASGPVVVPVEPFSGVAAAAGRVVVSGGTRRLTVRAYDRSGALGQAVATADLGRGQPDVLLAPDGGVAFVSTHFSLLRASYGITALGLAPPPESPEPLATLELPGAGFTAGAAKPASFALEAALAGNVLLVACGGGLSVVDVADPRRPRLLRTLSLPVRPVNVDAAGGLAAVVGSDPAPALILVDVRDPASPSIVRTVPLPPESAPTGVALDARRAVVAARAAGVVVVDR